MSHWKRLVSVIACSLCWVLGAQAEELWVINPSSERAEVPVVVAASAGTANGPVAATVAGSPIPADTWDGQRYLLADVPAMTTARVVLGTGMPGPVMAVSSTPDAVMVATDRGTWQFMSDGRLGVRRPNGTFMGVQLQGTGLPRPRYAGAAVTVLEREGTSVRFLITRSGLLIMTAGTKAELRWDAGVPFEYSLAANLGFPLASVANTERLTGTRDWLRLGGGSALHLGYAGSDATFTAQKLEFTGRLYLYPDVKSTWDSIHVQAALADQVVLGTDLTGGMPGFDGRVTVQDRNADGLPDLHHDRWVFDRGSDGKPETIYDCRDHRISIYHPRGKAAAEITLAQPKEQFDKYDIAIFGESGTPAAGAANALLPSMSLIDWNGDGVFLLGSVLAGGYLQQDRIVAGRAQVSAFDLDGDGDIDVADRWTSTQFDLEDRFIGIVNVQLSPQAGSATLVPFTAASSVLLARIGRSWYNKTYHDGRFYQGARCGFEEHINMKIHPGEAPEFPNGANFFLKTTDEMIDRMTFGQLVTPGGLAWNIELDPIEANNTLEERYQYLTDYRDPWGHVFKVRTIVFPLRWDGTALRWEKRTAFGNAVEMYPNAPWYRMTTGSYLPLRGLHLCITPESGVYGSNEGMYGGQLSHEERIERDTDGATFTLYYSSLMGGLHLKGAEFGYTAHPVGWPQGTCWDRRFWYHYADGITRKGPSQGQRQIAAAEGKRAEGPLFFAYVDRDRDQYADTYVFDMDNDGLYERALWYDAAGKHVQLQDAGFRAVWPYQAELIDVPYQMGQYAKVQELYRRGFREEAMIERYQLTTSGIPVERQVREENGLATTRFWRPPFYVVFGEGWLPKVAVYEETDAPDRFTWKDYSPTGFTRMGTLFTEEGLQQRTVRGRITPAVLEGISVLVIGHLSHVLGDAEVAALLAWVKAGGTLVLHYTSEDAVDRVYFNALGEQLGFTLGEKVENRTVVTQLNTLGASFTDANGPYGESRTVTPDNRISHYQDTAKWGLLDHLQYLSFVGCPLTVKGPMQPVLTYKGHTMMAATTFGNGLILVSGMNALANWHVGSSDYPEPGTDNEVLLSRIVTYLARRTSQLQVTACTYDPGDARTKPARPGSARVVVQGHGGVVYLPQLWADSMVTVNGHPVTPALSGALRTVVVPAGPVTVEITQQMEGKR